MRPSRPAARGREGVALFMVLAALAVLTFLVSEFVYVSQVNQKLAYDHFDQLKAQQMAKSGLKLSLLRLKAYQLVKGYVGTLGAAAGAIPPSVLNQIWSFPLMFPIPTDVPGLSPMDKDKILEFQKGSNLEGRFVSVIEPDSERYSLNSLLESDRAPAPDPSPSPSGSPSPTPSASPSATPSSTPTPFDPAAARQNLLEFLQAIFNRKVESDDAFSKLYRDYRLMDLVQNIACYVDPKFDSPTYRRDHPIPPKKAAFLDISELHQIPGIEEPIYDLLAPYLSANASSGFNVNTLPEPVFRGLFPRLSNVDIADFFKYRDSAPEGEDHSFKDVPAFWEWMKNTSVVRGDAREIARLQDELKTKGHVLLTEANRYRVTVTATVNTARRMLQATVKLENGKSPSTPPAAPPPGAQPTPQPTIQALPKANGIQIETLRIL